MLRRLLQKIKSPFASSLHDSFILEGAFVENKLWKFATKLPEWPTYFVPNTKANVHEVEVGGQNCFVFRGPQLGGNCAIVANCSFPSLGSCPFKPMTLPFSKIIASVGDTSLRLIQSRVAYYEVYIHSPLTQPVVSSSSSSSVPDRGRWLLAQGGGGGGGNDEEPCIVVGLACAHFPLRGRMPGWDFLSFGYHSDDGNNLNI
jgi:hypothetical protein